MSKISSQSNFCRMVGAVAGDAVNLGVNWKSKEVKLDLEVSLSSFWNGKEKPDINWRNRSQGKQENEL